MIVKERFIKYVKNGSDKNYAVEFFMACFLIIILVCISTAAIGGQIQKNRVFPEGSPPAEVIDVVDLMSAAKDTKLAAITLQGKINSADKSRVYLLVCEDHTNNVKFWPTDNDKLWPTNNDKFWLDWLIQKKHIKATNKLSLQEYFQKYSDSYQKVIVYDPNLPATINIGTMIASLEKAIVIAPADIEKYGRGKKVENLRGRWKSNVEAYQWAFDNLLPGMSKKIIACIEPVHFPHHLRDYLIRNKVFIYWITSKEKQDGVKSDFEKEKAFTEKLLQALPVNIPDIGYASATGFGQLYHSFDNGLTEYYGIRLLGEYGKFMLASQWVTNMSLLSGIQVDFKPLVSKYKAKLVKDKPVLDKSKVYISFDIVEAGDTPWYWVGPQLDVWRDPNRGKVPINYSLGGAVIEAVPPVMQWYYENATSNDHFFMVESGAGYAHPYRDFMSKTPDPEKGWKDYLELTQYYMDLLQLKDIALYTDAWFEFDRKVKDPVTLRFANGLDNLETLILGMGRDEGIREYNYLIGDKKVLVSHVVTRWDANLLLERGEFHFSNDVETMQWLVNDIRKHTPKERPGFIHVMALSWAYYPSDLLYILNELGDEYVAVSAADFKSLYLQSKINPPCVAISKDVRRKAFNDLIENYYHQDLYKGCFSVGKKGTKDYTKEIAYWINGQLLDVVIDAYNLGFDQEQNLNRIKTIYEDSYKDWGDYWKNASSDDILWWAMASYRIWKATGEEVYFDGLKDRFDVVYKKGFSPEMGAVTWEMDMKWNDEKAYYTSCTNNPYVITACYLAKAYGYKGKKDIADDYLNKAKAVYKWEKENLFGPNGQLYGGVHINKDGTIRDIDKTPYTYDPGTFIGASVLLYQLTADTNYLQNACKAAYYAKNNLINPKTNILKDETGMDGSGFKGIFCRYAIMFIDQLSKIDGKYDGKNYKEIADEFLAWMCENANSAWKNRNKETDLMSENWSTPSDNQNPYVWADGGAVMLLLSLELCK